MTQFTGFFRHTRLLCLLICAITFLSGCGPTQVKPGNSDDESFVSIEHITKLLNDAETAVGEEQVSLLLQASTAMIKTGELDWARNTLLELNPSALPDNHYFTYMLLSANLAVAEGEHFIAKRYLWEPRFVTALPFQPVAQQLKAHDQRATLLCDIAEFRQCVLERIQSDAIYKNQAAELIEERDLNQDLIWQALMELPRKDLQLEAQMQNDPIIQGWYTLAAMSKDNQTNLRKQLESVDRWVLRWPTHPASMRLPADLQLLKQLMENQPKKVAVLLPLSGKLSKASEAIRDGIMSAYYQLTASGDQVPDLRFFDTFEQDINTVYDNAINEGAELVIGPLDKDNIDDLTLRPALPVPTLALNYVEHPLGETPQLFQFGLAVEDEAVQVAERAWRDGHRRAMVLVPESNWGDRAAETFIERWKALGGSLVGDYRYKGQKDYSNLIRDAMDVSDSRTRAQRIRRILGQSVEFEPRARKDIDLIFLIAHPAQARQIKPTLAFHYAGHIPVYSTSHIYNGEIDSNADRDMDGIRFATLPWFFDDNQPEKITIDKYTTNGPSYQRLYALGVDAFHVYPRLLQLAQMNQAHFYGSTGTLRINSERKIVREQTWAQFVRGRAYAMPTVSYDENP